MDNESSCWAKCVCFSLRGGQITSDVNLTIGLNSGGMMRGTVHSDLHGYNPTLLSSAFFVVLWPVISDSRKVSATNQKMSILWVQSWRVEHVYKLLRLIRNVQIYINACKCGFIMVYWKMVLTGSTFLSTLILCYQWQNVLTS